MKKKQKILKNALKKFAITTPICKQCFSDINSLDFFAFFHQKASICQNCFKEYLPKFYRFKVQNIKAISIFEYDEKVQNLLFQIKGCFDIELSSCFLERYKTFFHFIFLGYFLVPIPSFLEADQMRGFNHVEEIFKILNLPILKILKKTSSFKQAEHSAEGRNKISDFIVLDKNINLIGKKILIIDDVLTTGSTMKAAIQLIKNCHPKDIKILVIARSHPELGMDVL